MTVCLTIWCSFRFECAQVYDDINNNIIIINKNRKTNETQTIGRKTQKTIFFFF